MGGINQAMVDTLRGMNTRASGSTYDPNIPIPRPGQPTNYQMTPLLGDMGPAVNQDINAFNAQQTIPGTFNGRPIPQSPTSTSVNIPGYGPAPVTYGPGMGEAAFNGTPPPTPTGWHPSRTRQLFAGVLAQHMNNTMSGADWQAMLASGNGQNMQGGQRQTMPPPGTYGRQAMNMAGLLAPPPGDTYPSGGKGRFRPGGK